MQWVLVMRRSGGTIACTIAGRNLTHAEWHTYLPNLHYQRTCPQWPAGS